MWQKLCELETRGGFSSRAADFGKWDYIWMKVQSHLQTLVWTAEEKFTLLMFGLFWVHTSQFTSEPGLVKSLVISSACHRIRKCPARWEMLAAGEVEKLIIWHNFFPVWCSYQLTKKQMAASSIFHRFHKKLCILPSSLNSCDLVVVTALGATWDLLVLTCTGQIKVKSGNKLKKHWILSWLYSPYLVDEKFRFILQKLWAVASAGKFLSNVKRLWGNLCDTRSSLCQKKTIENTWRLWSSWLHSQSVETILGTEDMV